MRREFNIDSVSTGFLFFEHLRFEHGSIVTADIDSDAPAVSSPPISSAPGQTHVRHKVLAMTVALGAITYLDRVTISVTSRAIARDLTLTPTQMGYVFSAFYLAYALFEIPSGAWGDRVGTRRVLTRIVCWWSAFTVLTGVAFNYSSLLVIRFLFGSGEAGAWPNAARTFSRWFPRQERGTAQGIFFMGAHLSGGLTPILVTTLLVYFNWRSLFALFGSLGFVWSVAWYRWFRDSPAEHPDVGAAERELIESGRAGDSGLAIDATQWKRLLWNRTVVCLCLMYFTQAFGGTFYVTWLPTYLASRGLTGMTAGVLAGLPLMLSAAADLLGGVATDRAARRFGLRLGRITIGGGALAAAGAFTLAGALVESPVAGAVLIALGGASSNFLLGAAWGTCLDIGGRRSGAVSAAMNTSGQVGSILSPILVAEVVRRFSQWSAPLYLAGILFLLGALCWLWIDPTKRVSD
jgi:ACS family glucarate transporter-like MFS transporter